MSASKNIAQTLAYGIFEPSETFKDTRNEFLQKADMLIQSAIDAAVREALEQAAGRWCSYCAGSLVCKDKSKCQERAAILGEGK